MSILEFLLIASFHHYTVAVTHHKDIIKSTHSHNANSHENLSPLYFVIITYLAFLSESCCCSYKKIIPCPLNDSLKFNLLSTHDTWQQLVHLIEKKSWKIWPSSLSPSHLRTEMKWTLWRKCNRFFLHLNGKTAILLHWRHPELVPQLLEFFHAAAIIQYEHNLFDLVYCIQQQKKEEKEKYLKITLYCQSFQFLLTYWRFKKILLFLCLILICGGKRQH